MAEPSVAAWLEAQTAGPRAMIDILRDIVRDAGPDLVESIKWNAPSFADRGRDRVTLGVERRGGVRLVLHRGATSGDDGLRFPDPDGVARWPSGDRGVATFAEAAEIEAARTALEALVRRWLAATA